MEEKINVHIISHTHWDREWYLNSKYTNEWLIDFFDNLFDMLEKEEKYVFVLDGQTSMLEDYFEELKKSGRTITSFRNKIMKYVKEGRLFIGPYYLQPDWNLVSEESLIRNLLIGNKIANELGRTMKVGWLLDNFGQISQTVQIHKGFGIKGLYVWRGVEMDPEEVQSEFLWESPDGSRMLSVYLLDSYRNAMRLAEYKDIMEKRIYDTVEKLEPFATTPNILMMNGYDQEMIPDDILPYLSDEKINSDSIRVFQSNPEKYLEDILKHNPNLKVLKGALYSGRFIAVFPGVLSSRMYLKLQNDMCQKALEKYAEPLSTINWGLGGEYEGSNLEQAWKMLLKNHPHDSICGVSIDDVHTDMEDRYRIVHMMVDNHIKTKIRELVNMINTSRADGDVNIIFNPSPYKRSEIVTIDGRSKLIKDIPPLGYRVIYNNFYSEPIEAIKVNNSVVQNKYVKVEFLEDGSFNLIHKETNKKYKGLGVFEDSGDAGDEYNYSYPDEDIIITTKNKKAEIQFIERSKERVTVRIKTILEVPESLTSDRAKRNNKFRKLPIINYVTIDADSPLVKCRTIIKNTVKDHRIRVLFPTDINTDVSFAGSAFDVIKRPIHIENYDESTIPEKVKKVIIGARESKPNTIFPQREFVDLNDLDKGLAIISRGLPEYQIINDNNTIALTLFRSVGWIATDVNTRIGDAGPKILTPDAQCLRQMEFEYAIYPHVGDVFTGKVLREADSFNSQLLIVKTDSHEGILPDNDSFLEIIDEKELIKTTAIKRSEDGRGIIVRFYNPCNEVITSKIKTKFDVKKAYYTNLAEEIKREINIKSDGVIDVKLNPKQIVTVRLEIVRKELESNLSFYAEIIDEKNYEDLTEYEEISLVTEKDITSEEKRYNDMKSEIDNPMMRRTVLEGKLSAMLTQRKYIEHEIRKLGYKLNDARVLRRVYDYIQHYKKNEISGGKQSENSNSTRFL